MVLDSWLVSLHSDHKWKWIYYLPCLQQTAAPNQNQRVHRFSCNGGFLCWIEHCTFIVLLPEEGDCIGLSNDLRSLFPFASVVNLCTLVLERYVAVVMPFRYLTFMKRRRVFLVIFISWAIPVITALAVFKMDRLRPSQRLLFDINISMNIIFLAFLPCCSLIFCFASMLLVVNKHERAARVLAKQLHFNHRFLIKIQEKSAVKLMTIVKGIFLLTNTFALRYYLKQEKHVMMKNIKYSFLFKTLLLTPSRTPSSSGI